MAKSSNISQTLNVNILEKELNCDYKTIRAMEVFKTKPYQDTLDRAKEKRMQDGEICD